MIYDGNDKWYKETLENLHKLSEEEGKKLLEDFKRDYPEAYEEMIKEL